MAITFQEAPTVAAGDPITSTQHNKLAEAYNTRIESGVGDCAWRIGWYLHSATKQVTEPEDANLWPGIDEFTKVYGNFKQADAPEWPSTAGTPNVKTNPLMKFVYGDAEFAGERSGIQSEDERLLQGDNFQLPTSETPLDPETLWQIAKYQRGFVDLTQPTEQFAAPALTAAQQHYKITPNPREKFLVSFGGWLPTPEVTGDCGDETERDPATEKLAIIFTNQITGEVRTYSGYCPMKSPGAAEANAIRGVYQGAFAYHVYLWTGSVVVLPLSEWIIGPFSGPGQLGHGSNAFIEQMMHRYLSTFRGSETERGESGYNAAKVGFDFQTFFTSQYLLAPSKGSYDAGPPESVLETTANATWAGPTIAAGTKIQSGIASGYVFGGLFVKGVGLTSLATVRVLVQGVVKAIVTISPESPTAYTYSAAGSSGAYSVALDSEATTEASGSIYVEVLELQDYKPGIHDAYFLMRLGSAPSSFTDSDQSDGDRYDQAKEIGIGYFRHGMVYNTRSGGITATPENDAAVNTMVESARRVAMDNMRVVSGDYFMNQIVKYAVIDGKSVLWCNRYVNGDSDADVFRDIAPMAVESGNIRTGLTYRATGGSVVYNGATISENGTFVGVSGQEDYTGAGTAWTVEGIRATAPAKDWSNEWVMFPTWTHYRDADESVWKEEAFAGPWVAFNNPCHVYSDSIVHVASENRHYNYGRRPILSSEAPSGHNFPRGDGTDDRRAFADSVLDEYLGYHFTACQIYKPPYQVESCVLDGSLVKLTFTTRFQHHPTAVYEVGDNIDTWPQQLLREETYQTDEGRLMKFLLHRRFPTQFNPLPTFGDAAFDGITELQSLLDSPYAAVIPKFYFIRLIPKAYEDGNDDSDSTDSVMTVESMLQMELYSRAMCEGFVDGEASVDLNACTVEGLDGARLFDFTFENAMNQAVGRSWFQTLPTSIVGSNTRGYGPLPRTQFYADIFNQFSSFVNLLTRARVDLPLLLKYRQRRTEGYTAASVVADSANLPAVGGGPQLGVISGFSGWAVWEGIANTAGFSHSEDDWTTYLPGGATYRQQTTDRLAFQASKESTLSTLYWVANGADYAWAAHGTNRMIDWTIDEDSAAWQAMSEDLQALLSDNTGLLMRQQDIYYSTNQWDASTGDPIPDCNGQAWPGTALNINPGGQIAGPLLCFVTTGGTVEAPELLSGRAYVQINAATEPCSDGGSSTTRTLTLAGGANVGDGNLFVTVPTVA